MKSSFNRKRQIDQLEAEEAFDAQYPIWLRNQVIEEVAQHIEKLKGFGKDTIDSFAIYIREMKK